MAASKKTFGMTQAMPTASFQFNNSNFQRKEKLYTQNREKRLEEKFKFKIEAEATPEEIPLDLLSTVKFSTKFLQA